MRHAGRFQEPWYRLAATELVEPGAVVLDVGAGDGYAIDMFHAAGASRVLAIDPAPLDLHVLPLPVEYLRDECADIVVACDVIEHVENDRGFLRELLRCARVGVFFSTPNWNHSRCTNPFHFREYTPAELRDFMLADARECAIRLWMGDDAWVLTPSAIDTVADDDPRSNFGVFLRKPLSMR